MSAIASRRTPAWAGARSGEFVHHAAQVADLPDDRAGQPRERVGSSDLLAVAPLQALGRKLDGRQRVLDLVRDAARHVRPGGGALVEQLVSDIVKVSTVPPVTRTRFTASVRG
jgi:hypothetical protein